MVVGFRASGAPGPGRLVPRVLQDHPVSNGVQMATTLVLRILENSPGCVRLKHASGGV